METSSGDAQYLAALTELARRTIAARIRFEMGGLSERELARRSRISVGGLRRILHGDVDATPGALVAIAIGLQLGTVEGLFGEMGSGRLAAEATVRARSAAS